MEQFIIAGLKTEYEVQGELLKKRSEEYRAEFDSAQADIRIVIKEGFLEKKQEEIPYLTPDEHEYMWTGEAFYHKLLNFNGMMLHSSCVEKDGQAYLFSARSGTGKSTHTYIDRPYSFDVVDYMGNVSECTGEHYIHLEEQEYCLNFNHIFEEFLNGYAENGQPYEPDRDELKIRKL